MSNSHSRKSLTGYANSASGDKPPPVWHPTPPIHLQSHLKKFGNSSFWMLSREKFYCHLLRELNRMYLFVMSLYSELFNCSVNFNFNLFLLITLLTTYLRRFNMNFVNKKILTVVMKTKIVIDFSDSILFLCPNVNLCESQFVSESDIISQRNVTVLVNM